MVFNVFSEVMLYSFISELNAGYNSPDETSIEESKGFSTVVTSLEQEIVINAKSNR